MKGGVPRARQETTRGTTTSIMASTSEKNHVAIFLVSEPKGRRPVDATLWASPA